MSNRTVAVNHASIRNFALAEITALTTAQL